jgi:hypothetical protein
MNSNRVFAITKKDFIEYRNFDSEAILTIGAQVKREGIDDGGKMTVVAFSKKPQLLTVKVDGHNHWSGTGQPWVYASAEYRVYPYTLDLEGDVYHLSVPGSPLMKWPVKTAR